MLWTYQSKKLDSFCLGFISLEKEFTLGVRSGLLVVVEKHKGTNIVREGGPGLCFNINMAGREERFGKCGSMAIFLRGVGPSVWHDKIMERVKDINGKRR